MDNKIKSYLEQLLPFIILGVAIAFAIGLFIFFSYVLVWGIIIGSGIWLIMMISNYFFPKTPPEKSGRIIEHDRED